MFNVLDVLTVAKAFAAAHRGAGDSDELGSAAIGLAGSGINDASWFDPVIYSMNLTPRDRWNDATVLHEYAHYLQAQLSNLAWIPSGHNGCTPEKIVVVSGGVSEYTPGSAAPDLVRAQHAWLEGFADWFALAAHASVPVGTLDSVPTSLEMPTACPAADLAGISPGDRLERHVAAYLWDITDPPPDGESWDTVGGPAMTQTVMEIFDRDLDRGDWPIVLWFTMALTQSPYIERVSGDLSRLAGENKVTWPFA